MIEDAQGHRLSGADEDAARAFDEGVRAFTLVQGDAIGAFDAAREAAPDFAMAHLAKAWVLTAANDPPLQAQAQALVETARGLSLNEREDAHLAALSLQVAGARAAAVAVLDRHLMRHPFDLVAHQSAALGDGFLGRFPWVRERSARACRGGRRTAPAMRSCWPITRSGAKRRATMPGPRPNRARQPSWSRPASGRTTRWRMSWR
jgi:hypothetical protein